MIKTKTRFKKMLKKSSKSYKSINFSTFGLQFPNKMKKYLLIILFACINPLFAQDFLKEVNEIAEAELKSSSQLVNFQANPNTANYDVTYQKLEFTIDPAVYFISGNVTTQFLALENMNTITFDLGRMEQMFTLGRCTCGLA